MNTGILQIRNCTPPFVWAAYPKEQSSKEPATAKIRFGGRDPESLKILLRDIFHDPAIVLIAEESDDAGTSDEFSKFTLNDDGTDYGALETMCVCPPGSTFSGYRASDVLAYRMINA